MCEHRECKHSLGPSSHCDECDRQERFAREDMLRHSLPRISLDAELNVCGNAYYPTPGYCSRQAGHVGPCALHYVPVRRQR